MSKIKKFITKRHESRPIWFRVAHGWSGWGAATERSPIDIVPTPAIICAMFVPLVRRYPRRARRPQATGLASWVA